MAWESIEHTCGHLARHQVYGKRDAREREMRGLSASPCPDCQAVELATERQKASEAAAAAAVETGLPALVGTEKQIAWAERIRADLLADPGNNVLLTLDRIQAHARITAELASVTVDLTPAELAAALAAGQQAYQQLRAQTDAAWWIDNRVHRARLTNHVRHAIDAALGSKVRAAAEAKAMTAELARNQAQQAVDAARAAEREAKERLLAAAADLAKTFHVQAVSLSRDNLTITSTDGRVALGAADDGDWFVYLVDGREVATCHPEIERIAAEAKSLHIGAG